MASSCGDLGPCPGVVGRAGECGKPKKRKKKFFAVTVGKNE